MVGPNQPEGAGALQAACAPHSPGGGPLSLELPGSVVAVVVIGPPLEPSPELSLAVVDAVVVVRLVLAPVELDPPPPEEPSSMLALGPVQASDKATINSDGRSDGLVR